MTNRRIKLILVAAISILVLAACGSDSSDVPSLGATPTAAVEDADPASDALDDEAKVMAFTQCMRDRGIEVLDPIVDSEGNVQAPKLAEGVQMSREEWNKPYEECAHHIEGLTFGRGRADVSEQLDQFFELAACLRDKGYDVDEPTAETLEQWGVDFRVEFDWDDPEAMKAYEECSSKE